jgi:NADH-quinone oxidoreductase subunit L
LSGLLWLLAGLPLGCGAVLAAAGRRAERLAWPAATAVSLITLADAVVVAVGRPAVSAPWLAGLPAGLAVDGLSAVLVITVTAVTLAVVAYAGPDVEQGRSRFYGLLLVFAGSMLVTVTATSLGTLLMAWEVMGATSYGLIAHWWQEPVRVRSATTAFLTTRAGDLGLYLAAAAAFAGAGTLQLDRLETIPRPWLHLVAAGVVAAALGKSAQLPFSFWLSRAMHGPSPVSALLHSATMVAAGAYLLLRLGPLLAATGWAGPVVAWVGALTALALGLVAVAQRDYKQLLAASTSAQLGLMVLAAGSLAPAAGTAHLLAHAATKALLFLAAGAFLHTLGTQDLAELRGAGRRVPLAGAVAAVGALSLAGVPPLSMWVTKDAVLAAARAWSVPLYVIGLAAGVVGAVYAGKLLGELLAPAPATDRGDAPARAGVPAWMAAPMVGLAVAAATLGVVGLPTVASWLDRTLGVAGAHHPSAAELTLSGVLAVVASGATVAAVRRRWRPRLEFLEPVGRVLAGWLGLERAAHQLVVAPTLALAHALAVFDDRVVDGAVNALAGLARWAARVAADRVDPAVDELPGGIAAAARRLGRVARRPQTGQLHQYYAQLVVGLGILALILLLRR